MVLSVLLDGVRLNTAWHISLAFDLIPILLHFSAWVGELFVPSAGFQESAIARHIHAVHIGRFIAPDLKVLRQGSQSSDLELFSQYRIDDAQSSLLSRRLNPQCMPNFGFAVFDRGYG